MMSKKIDFAVLLLHVLPLFYTSTPFLFQETSDFISTNITATINSPVTIQCFVHNPNLTLWLLQRKWCGYSFALTFGGYNLHNETYYLHIGNESGHTTYNLIVNQPSKEIEGTYICQERGINKVFATLHVDTDMASEKHLNVAIGTEVELNCIVHHQRFAVWIFRKDDLTPPMSLSAGETIFNDEEYSLNIENGTKFVVYNLIINSVQEKRAGMYVCKEEGVERVIFKINVEDDPKAKNLTVVVNSTTEMYCTVEDYQFALWLFSPSETTGAPVTLSSAGGVFNTHDYSLIIQHKEGFTTYNLIIYNTTENMQGIYTCREQGVSKAVITLIVEDPPEVWIEEDGSKLRGIINVTLSKNYDLTCIASGEVSKGWLSWERNSRNLSDEVTYQKSEKEVSSILRYSPLTGDTRLTCIFSGQIAVPSIKVVLQVNVLYPPYCNLSTSVNHLNQLMVYCSCVGNPEVSTVYIIVNDSLHTKDEVSISSKYPAYLNCFAENDFGQLSNKPTHKYKPSPIPITMMESQFPIRWVILTLSFILLLLCSLLGIIIFRKKRYEVSSSYFTWEPTVSRTTATMSERPPCRSPPTEHRFLPTACEDYEEVPVTDITKESDGLSTDEQVEYNAQYFDLPLDDSEEKIYAEADNHDQENFCVDTIAESRASTGSCFSDAEYFGPLSEGGTLDKEVRLLDARYKFN
ncbi:hypothetical protein HOLleu_34416 [Holothuria leucospilota]|uniref:Immunoglobulin domain-containing protein n=1 Tax=Holothuria leucospilota TaxID=206669 RepID=A0A9Q0YPR0_HOLLE|nr:hypothetical protein HOLleu_34416 [Holothuria leucospilota]